MTRTAMMDINPAPSTHAIRIHGLADARAALAAAAALGVPVLLASAPSAAAHAGAAWFAAVVAQARAERPDVAVTAILDCGDRAGDAQAALAAGVDHVVFRGRADVAARLAAIAAGRGARVLTTPPEALDLRGAPDPVAACTAWLTGGA